MPSEEYKRARNLLEQMSRTAAHDLARESVHNLAVSMASFIAAIDSSSSDVAAYIEQRLAPLAHAAASDLHARDALAAMVRDSRALSHPAAPSPAQPDFGALSGLAAAPVPPGWGDDPKQQAMPSINPSPTDSGSTLTSPAQPVTVGSVEDAVRVIERYHAAEPDGRPEWLRDKTLSEYLLQTARVVALAEHGKVRR